METNGRLTAALVFLAANWGISHASPNILVILADDLGIEHLDFYGIGEQFAPTPNLTALAAGGLVFREAWSNPLCSPTRATLQTGRYGYRTGIGRNIFKGRTDEHGLSLGELTLPELLKSHVPTAYASALIGKWHLGLSEELGGALAPNMAGYDHFEGVLENGDVLEEGELRPGIYFNYPKTTNGTTVNVVGGYITSDEIDWAISWIQTAPEPWLAVLTPFAPHAPFHWPPEDLHSQDTSQEGDVPRYHAMVEALDHELGRLLAVVEPSDTLIIFASDNGSPRDVALPPVRRRHAKGTLFQGGIRVPLIIAGTGVTAGEVDGIVNISDLYATIGEVAEATIPPDLVLDSVSLVPYFAQPDHQPLRAHVFSEIFSPNGPAAAETSIRTVRNGRYKYGQSSAGVEKMADLLTDPWETVDLLATPLSPEEQQAYDELKGVLAGGRKP